jgi:CRP-like cAMP-binding protein
VAAGTKLQQIFNFLNPKEDKIVESIKRFPLFQSFAERDIQILAQRCYVRFFAPEEEIYAEESPGAAIYFIVYGSVGVYRKRRSNVTDRIQVIKAGAFFGESALVNEAPRRHSVKAVEKTEVLVLFKTDFERLEQTHPRLALAFFKFVTLKFFDELNIFQVEFHELSQKIAKDQLKNDY